MNKKYYIRNGRKFERIEYHEGMYYQENGTFQEKRDECSIGLCIISDFKQDVIMTFESVECTYVDVLKEEKLLPMYIELFIAINKYNTELNLVAEGNIKKYWIRTVNGSVSTDFGRVALRSCSSGGSDGGVGCLGVGADPDYRYSYCGSRELRKVIRIKK